VSEIVSLHIDGPVARLTLARTEKLNALTVPMLERLDAACARLERSDAVRVVLVGSSNPKAFCAGADIAEWGALSAQDMWRVWTRAGHRIFDRLAAVAQPTIALIHGMAFGGGLELALACDLRLSTPDARFGMPEVKVGAIQGWGGTKRLARLIGVGHAKQMIFRAMQIDAATALRWGLVEEIVEASDLHRRAQEIADEIAAGAPGAVRLAKQLIDLEAEGLSAETFAAGLAASFEDAREGVAAFKEKRLAHFKGL
jgi:enoyl-CoA hydratase/carnithine racemase